MQFLINAILTFTCTLMVVVLNIYDLIRNRNVEKKYPELGYTRGDIAINICMIISTLCLSAAQGIILYFMLR